jgi:hypothetical protein
MKMSELFLKAAERVEDGLNSFACHAIRDAVPFGFLDSLNQQAQDFFAEHFKPKHYTRGQSWFGPGWMQENRDRRVVALTLAAAIAEKQGL